ncbi:MAG TPA: carboxylating nicotinate-nucleotide diphosphorylase [Jiangellaceae bacterium]
MSETNTTPGRRMRGFTHAPSRRLPPARRPMTPTPFDELPADLLAELAACALDPSVIYQHVLAAFEEDLPGDALDTATVAAIPPEQLGVADFVAHDHGVVAGLGVAAMAFHAAMGDAVAVSGRLADGTRVEPGQNVMQVSGPTAGLLIVERTALNFATHLSGVATATAAWVEALADTNTRVLDTRKTLPGWRALQKYAVRCGGGVNHRMSLADRAIVKDNHALAAGGVVPAFQAVRARFPRLRVEVEVADLSQLTELLDAGCAEILLDNMDDDQLAEAVRIVDGRATLEASGGMTLERAAAVGATGVDFVSVGALTHSAVVLDIGMDLHAAADIGDPLTVLG